MGNAGIQENQRPGPSGIDRICSSSFLVLCLHIPSAPLSNLQELLVVDARIKFRYITFQAVPVPLHELHAAPAPFVLAFIQPAGVCVVN